MFLCWLFTKIVSFIVLKKNPLSLKNEMLVKPHTDTRALPVFKTKKKKKRKGKFVLVNDTFRAH